MMEIRVDMPYLCHVCYFSYGEHYEGGCPVGADGKVGWVTLRGKDVAAWDRK